MIKPPTSWRLLVAGAIGLSAAAAMQPRVAMAQPSPVRPLVFVEDSPEASDRFDRARSLREQGRMSEAASAFQLIIDEFPSKLLETGGGTYIDAPVRVRQELSLDPALLEAYRSSFEPIAQRELSLALASENQAQALATVYQRYTLTQSGLKAAMALASLRLVLGEPGEAAVELDRISSHPDLESVRKEWQLLQSAAAVYLGQADRFEQYRKLVEASGDAQAIAQLKEWTASSKVPMVGGPAAQPRAKLRFPPASSGPIWDRRLNDENRPKEAAADENDDPTEMQPGRVAPGRPWTGVFPVIPVGVGDAILIDNNKQVRALDRFSGRELWVYSGPEDEVQINGIRPWQRMNGMPSDQRAVAVDGFRAVAVLGTPSYAPMGIIGGQATSLNCVAIDDGRLLWRVESKDFDPAFASAGFIGTPVIDRHRAYAMLKRSQNSGDQYTYLVAVDLATGKPLWRRTLSTSPMNMMYSMGRAPKMTLDADRLYVTDSSSVAGCVDCATGAFSWLSVTQEPGSSTPMYGRVFGVGGAAGAGVGLPPVRVEAGLLVPGLGPGRSPLLFDPRTGKKIARDLNDGTWPDVMSVQKVGDDLLVVGSSIRLISGRTLEARWSKSLSDLGEGRPVGLPTIDDGQVVLPMHDRAVAVRIADGTVAWQLLWLKRLSAVGNLLWLDGQLVGANDDSITSYMNWDMAYQSLKAQIAATPYDPRPALALAQLAIASGQKQAALEGADMALEALRHMPPNVPQSTDGAPAAHPHQLEVFQQLLSFAEPGRNTDPGLRQEMFERMSAIASSSPSLEVRYRMALGAFMYEIAKPADAVDQYQAVLSDKTLASQMFESVPASRRAGTEAKVRLQAIIEKSGVLVYAKYDAIAARTLADCKSRTPVDTDGLIALAEEYPFAKASERALVAAAEALASSNPRAAIAQLNRAYLKAADPADIQQIVGRLVQLHTDSGQAQRAVGWLERLRREHKGLDPLRDGKPMQIGLWLAELQAQQKQSVDLPALTLPMGRPLMIPGRLLVPTAEDAEAWPRDRVLSCEATKLKLLAGANLETAWEAAYNTASMRLLSMSSGQVVLWVEDSKLLLVLDAATGKPAWHAIQAAPLMQEVGGDAEREASRPAEQRAFMEMFNPGQRVLMHNRVVPFRDAMAEGRSGFICKINDSVICLGDRAGRVVGIDRSTGEVIWRFLCPMEQLNLMELGPDALVLGGITGKLTESQTGTVVVLDPLTGEMRLSPLEDKSVPRWVGLAGEGLLLHRTDTELVIRQISGDAPPKRIPLSAQAGDVYTRLGSNTILVTDAPGSLAVYDADSGKLISRIGTAAPTDPAWMQVDPIGQKWLILTQTQEALISPDGKAAWRDGVVADERSYVTQLVGQKYVILLSSLGKPAEPQARQAVVNGQMVEVWRAGGNPVPLVLPGNRGRVVRAIRNQGQNPNDPSRSFQYKAFILNRETGSLVSEISLVTQDAPIDPASCQIIDHKLAFTAGGSTIVVPDGEKTGP